MDSNRLIQVKGLSKKFQGHDVLKGLDLEVYAGEVLAIMGSSGAGKSVLLKHMAGLMTPDVGSIFFKDKDIVQLSETKLNEIRLRFGMVFQFGALFNSMTVGENVALALRYHHLEDKDAIEQIVRDRLEEVNLLGSVHKLPGELSGGMKKRASLARALALEPDVIFYDEPTTGLDPVMCENIEELIRDTNRKRGVTSVVVTHDVALAFGIGSRIAMLHEGKIHAVDTPEGFERSESEIVKQFLKRAQRQRT